MNSFKKTSCIKSTKLIKNKLTKTVNKNIKQFIANKNKNKKKQNSIWYLKQKLSCKLRQYKY